MVRDQVLVVTEKGESETDAGIVIAASVSFGVHELRLRGENSRAEQLRAQARGSRLGHLCQ